MLQGVILFIIAGVILAVFSFFLGGTFTISTEFIDAFQQAGVYLSYINLFFPVDTLVTIMGFVFSVMILYFSARMAFYIIALVRGNDMPSGGKL